LLLFIVTIGAYSQEESVIVGLGSTLELEDGLWGVNGRAYYGLNERFCFGPEVSYFPYQSIDSEYEKSILDLNFNAHYIFEVGEKIGLYPLTGLNYTIEEERLIDDNNENEEEEEFGLNYGVGIHYNIEKVFVFAEFKGIIGSLGDEFLTVGAIIPLKKKEKEGVSEARVK